MYLIDTDALSALRRPERADPGLVAWAARTPTPDLYLSAITVFEIELGTALAAHRDPAQGAVLRAWIDERVMPVFRDRILPVDATVARRCALLNVPDRRPHGDGLIAATALVHRLTVVTRNVRDFEPMGVAIVTPWTG